MTRYDDIWAAARTLPVAEKARLLEQLSAALRRELPVQVARPSASLYGTFADLGTAPSADDIDEARREMGSNFPRGDL